MSKQDKIQIYDDSKIRTHWDSEAEKWYISIVDVVAVLTDQSDFQKARKYWNKLKERLKNEGNQTVTNCHQLKMLAADGKMRKTELILNMLAEASTKDISKAVEPENFEETIIVAKQGGNVAKVAREELEAKTGKKVITSLNAKTLLTAIPADTQYEM